MRQSGHSVLEVLVSAFLLAVALVPLLQLYPQLVSANATQQDTSLLAVVASGRLEELAQAIRAGAGSGAGQGPCGAVPRCLLLWSVSDVSADPTAGWLRDVRVVACRDEDSNGACDPQEPQVPYATRVTSRP